jgi:uncharacterized membrane protein
MPNEKKALSIANLIILTLVLILNVVTLVAIFDKDSKKRVERIRGQIRDWFKDKAGKLKKKKGSKKE